MEIEQKIVGAVWVKNIAGLGNIDDAMPEFVVSLYKNYRDWVLGPD